MAYTYIVVIVGVQLQVLEHIVGQSISNITSVKLQAEEHEAYPGQQVQVGLANHLGLFFRRPLCKWIPSVASLIGLVRSERNMVSSHRRRVL